MSYSPASFTGGFGDAGSPLRHEPRSPGGLNADLNDDARSVSSHGSGGVRQRPGDADNLGSQRLNAGPSEIRQEEKNVAYVCGECRKSVIYKVGAGEMLRCKNCGYRIFFKQRGGSTAVYDCR